MAPGTQGLDANGERLLVVGQQGLEFHLSRGERRRGARQECRETVVVAPGPVREYLVLPLSEAIVPPDAGCPAKTAVSLGRVHGRTRGGERFRDLVESGGFSHRDYRNIARRPDAGSIDSTPVQPYSSSHDRTRRKIRH